MPSEHSRSDHAAQSKSLIELGLRDPEGLQKRLRAARCSRSGGLFHFVKLMWEFVEPARPFVENWHIHAICDHLEAVTRGEIKRLLINVPPGFMKEVSVDEPVLMRRGRIRLGDVVVGDEVLTHLGRYREVLAVHDKGLQSTLTVTTAHGRRVCAELRHPFLTPRGWIEARDLQVGDILAAVIPTEELSSNAVASDEARLLGYIVGDGGVTHSPTFTNADEEILQDFERCALTMGFSTKRRTPRKKKKAVVIGLSGALPWLKRHGLHGHNSYTKRIPDAVLASGNIVISNFLGAYWSCDGNINVRHTAVRGSTYVASCTTVGKELAHDIQHALLRIGISARVRKKTRKLESKKQAGGNYVYYMVMSCNHHEVSKFLQLPGLCQNKKRSLVNLSPRKFYEGPLVADEIVAIESSGQVECRCLTVADDHSFTANDIAVHNSLLINVFWPAWEWGPMRMASMRYLSASYSQDLTIRDNVRFRMIITADLYTECWGDVFQPSPIQFSLTKVANTRTGWKLATSVGGVGTGERGDRVLIDDPNSVKDAESDKVRDSTNQWLTEVVPTRLNNPSLSAILIIQQRTHEDDASGTVITRDMGYEHLMIPMRYDPTRRFTTSIGWTDPRGIDENHDEVDADGALAWPEMYPEEITRQLENDLGPYASAGQFQQSPVPRGGAIFDREWWQPWDISPDGKIRFPAFDYVVASVDTAFTEKQSNDYSAMTVWGVFRHTGESVILPRHIDDPTEMMRVAHNDYPRVMLMYGWQKRLSLHGPPDDRPPHISNEEWNSPYYTNERQKTWGLVEWVAYTAKRYRIDHLLIETQAAGHSLEQELRRLHSSADYGVQLIAAKGDKSARAYAVQHLFSNGLVHAPMYPDTGAPPVWADVVISQFSSFPKKREKDIVDSGTHALQYLRDSGVLVRREEHDYENEEQMRLPGKRKPLYDV